ncbi:polyketide synthase [Kutzneria sp. CA-103260]|uniref:polyketide synthase n=1 Tax=Kutzneria sp. CA-103260 TaxID=2802641 RepID=UPI001BA754B4|nr:polyketide synthase [Kutzneria sp. CA-103260]QUQ72491.1 FabA-like domain protein [Kutzneria sp. CA-103260]
MVDRRIAVVGMACLLPGAQHPDQFWDGLLAGADHRTLGGHAEFGTGPEVPGGWGDPEHHISSTRGGFVTEPALDLSGLALPESTLDGLDPVFRWTLHTARGALRDAGLTGAALARTGLVMGNYSFPTRSSVRLCAPMAHRAVSDGLARLGIVDSPGNASEPEPDALNLWPFGQPPAVAATALRLGGPYLALDAACSSALYSVALARDYLLTGRADAMLAGAVCAPDPLLIQLAFSDLRAYSPDGVSQPFDARTTGIVTGQGAGMFVLKRYSDAVRDGDVIHAVIESVGLSNDGAGRHVLAPNQEGQVAAYRQAYQDIDPETVHYVECHATGTPLGDGTELRGLQAFFGTPPALGSVKGNVGHLLTVAGFASMLKTVLAMRHGILPATPGIAELVRPVDGEAAATRVVRESQPWPVESGTRRAGVSAFGFGGTNAHIVLSNAATADQPDHDDFPEPPRLAVTGVGALVGSAGNAAALQSHLRTGASLLAELPAARWYGLDQPAADRTAPRGGYLTDIPTHPRTHRIPPNELAQFNPQHLALFEVVEQALADAGFATPPTGTRATEMPSRRVAVVLAMELEPRSHTHRIRFDIGTHVREELARTGVRYDEEQVAAVEAAVRGAVHDPVGANEVLSYIGNIMASRVSAAHNFTGPSFTLAADATAGARALEVAQLLLLDPTVEAVVVGGVDLAAGAENTRATARLAAEMPPLGDGAAALILTRADTAVQPYAVLDAVQVTRGEAPDLLSTCAAEALRAAGRTTEDVAYLVLGGATAAERHAEVAALGPAHPEGSDPFRCALGGLAPTVGATGAAAPLLSLVHAVLTVHERELPAAPSDLLANGVLAESGFTELDRPQPWLTPRREAPRTAMVSVPGDHAVAQIVVSSPRLPRPSPAVDWVGGPGLLLLPLSAVDGPTLVAAVRDTRERLADGADPLALVRQAVAAPRAKYTAVFVAADQDGLLGELGAAERDLREVIATGGEWATPAGSYCTGAPIGPDGRVAFVYPGAFTTYPGVGRELFRLFPALLDGFEAESDRPAERFKVRTVHPRGRLDKRDLMRHEARMLDDVPFMLAAGTNHAVLHTRLLRDLLGVKPDGAFGYSLGESSMLFATGMWDELAREDGILAASPLFQHRLRGRQTLVREAWRLPDELPDDQVWTTQLLLAEPDQVRAAMHDLDRVYLTHVNTPREVVVAGDPGQVRRLVAELGAAAARTPANQVMHCALVEPEHPALAALNDYPLGGRQGRMELFSAYDYDTIDVSDRGALAERIASTLCRTVDFARLVDVAYERGYRYFVEVGPGGTCSRWVADTLADRPHAAVTVDRRGASTAASVSRALATLVSHGVPVDLSVLFPATNGDSPALPSTVTCGGESLVNRVVARVAAVWPGPDRSAASPPEDEVTSELDAVVVSGKPFVYVPAVQPVARPTAVAHPEPPVRTSVAVGPPPLRAVLDEMGAAVAAAHRAALHAQHALADSALRELERPDPAPGRPLLTEQDLLEFASGRVEPVFGPAFAEIDSYPRRCRLPAPPYHFVSRVTKLEAETGRFEPCGITTEYDVPTSAWYTVDGLVPCAVTIEAGQCDMLLISYLGVDFHTRGQRVYRLLDSRLVFRGGLPREGQTLRYDIRIDRFVWQGDSLLFFFNYRCYADDELILELLDACAGFFTTAELVESRGVVRGQADERRRAAMKPSWFKPLARTDRTSLTAEDLEALGAGQPERVFGPAWDQSADGCNRSLRLPDPMLRMVDEVTAIDRLGGPRRLGALSAVKRLDPQGWYFRCHFPGDPVLAGSLVAEGAVQLLQIYALYLGMHFVLPDAEFQSVPGLRTEVKVRGQITPDTPSIRYEVDIIELTMLPRPTVIADILVYDGDKPIVSMTNFGIQVRERPGTPYRPMAGGMPEFLGRRNASGEAAFINELHLAHAAKGDLETAMGSEFAIYAGRRAPYIPNGDFRFVDRIMHLGGIRGVLAPGATMVTEYDSPPEAWYYTENGAPTVPNCVVMESSLQAAILLGYYLGATLQSPDDELAIRNLDGSARFLRHVDLRGRTIRQETELLASEEVPGAILQRFRYELAADGEPFYTGESLFGYFTDAALASQIGLDAGRHVPPWLHTAAPANAVSRKLSGEGWPNPATGPRIGTGHLQVVGDITMVRDGGVHGTGYVHGRREVRDDDWYFDCHFHRDPVMPGSLGVEAVVQALQLYVIEHDLAAGIPGARFVAPRGVTMRWKYRGQVLRGDGEITFDAHVKEVRRDADRLVVIADASVWKPGLRIYELTDVAVEVVPTEGQP